jgi:hypothetical protein
MARIPQFQEQFVSTVVPDSTAGATGQNIANIGKLANQAISAYNQIRLAKETTRINEMKTDFALSVQEDYNKMEQQRLSNPEGFSKDFDAFLKNKKSQFIDSSDLSSLGKSALSQELEGQRSKFVSNAINFEDKQQVLNFAESVERTAVKNNMLAYRAGENLNINELGNIEKTIDDNVFAGSTFLPREQLQKMKSTQTTNAYSDFIKGVASSDLNYASQLIEDKSIQDKLGSIEEIDRLRGYISQVKNRQEQNAKDALEKDKSLRKAAEDVNVQTTLETEFQAFNIGQKDGKDIVKNDKLNDIDSLMSFRDNVKNAYSQGQITDEQYKGYIAKTGSAFANMIESDKLGYGGFPLFTSVNEQLTKDINRQFKDNPELFNTEYVSIYEDTVKQLQQEGISLRSVSTDSKLKAQDLLKQNTEKYIQLKTSRNDAQSAIVGNRIYPLNSQSKTKGNPLDNGGFILEEDAEGNKAYVRRDANGKVLEIKEVR